MQKKAYREIPTPDGGTQRVRFMDENATLEEVKQAMAEEDTVVMAEEHARALGAEHGSEEEEEAAYYAQIDTP